jgi:predicted O-linked N-acetylglucosamine transferase (SPINDLY family)
MRTASLVAERCRFDPGKDMTADEQDYALAVEAHRAGDLLEAERRYRKLLENDPRHAAAWRYLGSVLCQKGRYDEGASAFRTHLTLWPDAAAVRSELARALRCLGKLNEAADEYRRATVLEPSRTDYWRQLATALVSAGRLIEAVSALRGASDHVHDAGLLLMLGGLEQATGQSDAAYETYSRALRLTESNAHQAPYASEVLFRRAAISAQRGALEAGRQDVAQLMRISPEHPYAAGLDLYLAMMACDWNGLEGRIVNGLEALRAGRPALPPWIAIAAADAPEEQRLAARIWVATTCGRAREPLAPPFGYAHSRLRIAYVSADFADHPVAHAIAPLIEKHCRRTFEVFGVSIAPQPPNPMLTRLRAGFDEFLDLSRVTDDEAGAVLRAREIDVLIDLTGYTARSRPNIFAARPAPLQINFLGYPGTMGAEFIDLVIADRVVIPEERRATFDERVAYLPGCMLPPNEAPRISNTARARHEADLPESAVVLAAFHTPYKLTPAVFDTWLRILGRTPESLLWLGGIRTPLQDRLRARAAGAGISPGRLVFAPRVDPIEAHLGRLAAADLYLDTLPYNAHTSAGDALRAGVPVLTCAGKSFAARMGASLLIDLGLPELVTTSLQDYQNLAVELVEDGSRRRDIRNRLELLNARSGRSIETYCRALENLFVEAHLRGRRP